MNELVEKKENEIAVIESESCTCETDENYKLELKLFCSECLSTVEKVVLDKPMKKIGISALSVYLFSSWLNYAVFDNRYPIKVEYELVDACLNSSSMRLDYRFYSNKKKYCLCAVEDTMNEISYTRFKVNKKSFIKSMKDNINDCAD